MRNPKNTDDLIAFVMIGGIVIWLLYYLWVYAVGFLALCGVYYLYLEYWNKPKS